MNTSLNYARSLYRMENITDIEKINLEVGKNIEKEEEDKDRGMKEISNKPKLNKLIS